MGLKGFKPHLIRLGRDAQHRLSIRREAVDLAIDGRFEASVPVLDEACGKLGTNLLHLV